MLSTIVTERAPFKVAVDLADTKPGERVLDVSGHAGRVALEVASDALSVEAVQPHEELIGEGRRLARAVGRDNVYFHSAPLYELPFDDAQFDLAFWCLGVSGEPQPTRAMKEIARVLAPEGRLVLQDTVAFTQPSLDLRIWELERRRNPAHIVFYAPDQLDALLALAGLPVRKREHSGLTQDFEYWADSGSLPAAEASELKRLFFQLPPHEQDLLDLMLADGRISFTYPILTLLAGNSLPGSVGSGE